MRRGGEVGRQNLKRRDVDSPQRDKFRARSGREGESQKQRRGENWKKQTSTDRNPQEQNSESDYTDRLLGSGLDSEVCWNPDIP